MKKIVFILVLFILSALVINTYAQEKLHNIAWGTNPVNFLQGIDKGMVLTKYIGHRKIVVVTQSASGKRNSGFLTPGTGILVPDDYQKKEKIQSFMVWHCGNPTEVKSGDKGLALFIPTDSLQWVVSGNELEEIHNKTKDGDVDNKLYLLLEKEFSQENNTLIGIKDELSLFRRELVNELSLLRISLNGDANENKEDEEKIESSSDWWKWALGAVGVITLGVITYKLLQQKDGGTTIIVNPPITPPTGGPANPNNSMAPGGGFGLSFGVRF